MLEMLTLNTTNMLSLRGPITEESVSPLIHAAMSSATPPQYLYLDTNGGDVLAGMRLVQLVTALQLTCVVFRAYSMGFAILQHCTHRLLASGATLMQHQMSLALQGEYSQVRAYLAMAEQLGRELDTVQARRLHVSVEWFRNRTQGEWWMAGPEAIRQSCADATVGVRCSRQLARQNVTLGMQVMSACPLVSQPLAG
jgi:ATP-dependent protease ClpP protease subunit